MQCEFYRDDCILAVTIFYLCAPDSKSISAQHTYLLGMISPKDCYLSIVYVTDWY